MSVPLIERWIDWYCPACKLGVRKPYRVPQPGDLTFEMHICPRLGGMSSPMVVAGTRAKVTAREREDYEGGDAGNLTLDENGRPIMSIVTTRDEGEDVMVFAPVVRAGVRG
jgi:hypothetical protein